MTFFTHHKDDRGFTLIEVLAALSVFSIMTVGLVPLFMSSLRGAATTRGDTVSKNVALEGLERARGLPFFVDYSTQKGYPNEGTIPKVDLLDIYFPSYVADGTYETTCTDSSPVDATCALALPADHTLTYIARFVKPQLNGSGDEEFVTVIPATTYRWDPPDPYTQQDRGPTQLVELTVRAQWVFGGATRSFEVSGLIGEREFGDVTVRGSANVDYTVRTSTVLEESGDKSLVQATAGIAESRIETKVSSTADQTVRGAQLRLLTVPSDPTVTPTDVVPGVDGATTIIHAPPDSIPFGDSGAAADLVHPSLGPVAGIDSSDSEALKVSVLAELPIAQGGFDFNAPTGTERLAWSTAQADGNSGLFIDASVEAVRFLPLLGETISGNTKAFTTAVDDVARRVETAATTSFGRLRALAARYPLDITDGVGSSPPARPILLLDDFEATVICKSTPTGSATATKQWSATLRYWADILPTDDLAIGAYEQLDLSSAAAVDPLATIGNPVVFDAPNGQDDLHLFNRPANGERGYLASFTSELGSTGTIADGGKVTQAAIEDAIRFETAPLDQGRPDSALSVRMGSLSCEGLDAR